MSTIPSATSDVQWENTAVRLAALGCASAFVAAHALKCRIYAWLAINARAQGNSEAYESHKASFNSACQTMDNSVKTKQDDMEKLLGQVRESRKSKILGPTFDKKGQLWPSGLYTVGCNLETQRKIGNYLSWFVEDSVTGDTALGHNKSGIRRPSSASS
ncbi:uncharacterized protein N7477_004935 [Penicillium maclennaniae]|uniref:uncharacterized protein n=1 Tax=Penicillium maclennaniae TaxID=1343394 RepID=UPI0025419720|nr:uncharacterized protein N7477_004935 [Penicillium maclennaniae]KAJ5675001.1 hypothetical protein N7477_004935 [Penicillium maclennaniae]